jgi:predicted O-linked N-acetylglucosamine transferase (SPINDLY family)
MNQSSAAAHLEHGRTLRAADDYRAAVEAFRAAVETDPTSAEALAELADTLAVLGRPGEAVPFWQAALALEPEASLWHCGLGDALHAQGLLPQAIAAYRAALARDQSLIRAWWGLGCACLVANDYAAAAESLGYVVTLAPDQAHAWHNLGSALFELGQTDSAINAYEKALALMGPNETTLAAIATIIPGSPEASHRAVLDARRRWAAMTAPEIPRRTYVKAGNHCPLRIGYVCAFYQDRNWMKPVWGVINNHDRTRFEVHLFSDAPQRSIEHGYAQDPRDCFHDISGLANAAVAQLVEDSAIDVLIDLNAFSAIRRLPLFALRPAPVQVAWFNMFGTSGMNCFDALVADTHVVLPGEEEFYSEPIVRLNGCYLSFEVAYSVPPVVPPPSLSGGTLTFGCFAPQYKLTPQSVEISGRILRASPRSRLILKNRAFASQDNRGYFQRQFEQAGVDTGRVELVGPSEHFAFLSRYADVDIALDTFPYNGGTTTMEAIWQGVPVLCFCGDRWAARISASLMHNAGLAQFVAGDLDDYAARAIELANDPATPAMLGNLRGTMRERVRQSQATDVKGLSRQLEAVYLQLWDNWREKSKPT